MNDAERQAYLEFVADMVIIAGRLDVATMNAITDKMAELRKRLAAAYAEQLTQTH